VPSEERKQKRRAFSYVGTMEFGDGTATQPCELSDISDGGARLTVFMDPKTIPDRFALLLSPQGNVRRLCRVAWRSAQEIGVQFCKPEQWK
jgi:hypothetical protein